MNKYEMMFIVRPDMEEAEIKKAAEAMKKVLTDAKAKIIDEKAMGQRELAYYQAKFMWQYWQKLNIEGSFQIIPVPIYYKRLKQRKYNHMELVAQEFSKLSGYPVNVELMERIKDTKPQYKLNKSQRMCNLSNAFKVHPEKYLPDKKILIIDDICTTGSTYEEMINTFHNCGIKEITCFATTTPWE